MTQYDNTNRGVLFKNDRKEQDNHPDYKGSINIDGQEFWLSAWIKESQKGKFMSLSVKPKEMVSTGKHSFTPGGKVKREDPISTGRMPAKQNILPPDDMQDEVPF